MRFRLRLLPWYVYVMFGITLWLILQTAKP
jgi:hypothetical protein